VKNTERTGNTNTSHCATQKSIGLRGSAGSEFKHFSGAGEVLLISNLIPLRRLRSLGSIQKHLSGAGEVFIHTFPAPEKCLYTLIWRRSSRRSRRSRGPIYIYTCLCIIIAWEPL